MGPKAAVPMLRIGTVLGVPKVLRNLGLNPHKVLSEGGFDAGLFADPDNLISFTARGRLFSHCAAAADCEHFGLLVGQQAGLHSLGLLGLLVKYSTDVSTALKNLVRYFHLHARGVAVSLEMHGDIAILEYRIHQGGVDGNTLISDGALAVLFNVMRELCGPRWRPTEVRTMHKEPEDSALLQDFFKARLCFNAEQNALVFRSSWLQHTLPEVHSEVRRMVQKQIDALATQHEDEFPEQVRAVLRAALNSGDLRANRVAAIFSIHPRTLNRRLQASGFGYQQLVDESRYEIGKQMLQESNLAINEIALMLHYADARSYIRAFRRCSGETPARWRATQKRLRRALDD